MQRSIILSLLGVLAASCVLGQEVAFRKRPTQLHDVSHQVIHGHLAAERTIRQHQQLVDRSKQTLQRKQERTLTVLEINQGRPTRAKIVYETAVTHIKAENNQAVEVIQPVSGHAYWIARRGDELLISGERGAQITEEEDKVLRIHFATFGQRNPLADFLDGRRIQVGQSIDVPDEVARELLGLTGNTGKTDKLNLRLTAVRRVEGVDCGVFETLLRTSGQETAMSLLMKGDLIIEIDSCRTRSIRLHGPVAISETRGPVEGRFVVSTNGTLQVAVQTAFDSKAKETAAEQRLQR